VWWFTLIILATQEIEVGGLWFKTSLGKISVRLYLKNKLKTKEANYRQKKIKKQR
jgi:hypothetical protein